jgi:hypothetical protein
VTACGCVFCSTLTASFTLLPSFCSQHNISHILPTLQNKELLRIPPRPNILTQLRDWMNGKTLPYQVERASAESRKGETFDLCSLPRTGLRPRPTEHTFHSNLLYLGTGIAQSVLRHASGWTVPKSNPGGGARFSAPVQTCPGPTQLPIQWAPDHSQR